MGPVTFHSLTMRNILQFSLVFLCFLSHLTEALFFGPIAVGLGLGILAFKKGFLIGTALSSSRTRRSYQPSNYRYTQNHHYDSNYNRWYSKPRRHYYYSSSPYYGRRGKRDTELPEMLELKRIKREVEAGGFDINNWYRDMTEMDQDGCGKKLICELRAKQKSGFTEEESLIAENFGSGTEMDNLDRMKRDLENEEVEVDKIEEREMEETAVEFRNLQEKQDNDEKNWVWT